MIEVRHATDPDSLETATAEQLRRRYVVESLFVPGEVNGVYTHEDRMLVAGAVPGDGLLELASPEILRAAHALERRELGVVNVGEPGDVLVDGEPHRLGRLDGLYVGRGHRVAFRGTGARFYLVSATAHAEHPVVAIPHGSVEPVQLGDRDGAGERALHRYVWGGGHPSCQLQFGVTVLAPGSVWNTCPPHLHDRRTEVYLYTGLAPDARVLHVMGRPGRTRHVLVADGQAVISPPWSVHCGVGTSAYAFVWAMAGENTDYGDLAPVPLDRL